MSVKLIALKCPGCGAVLNIEEGREQAFCTYCGAKILMNNENEYIYRHIDEAQIKQAETDQIVRMKQMEIAEEERVEAKKMMKTKIIISLVLAAIGILALILGGLLGKSTGDLSFWMTMIGLFSLIGVLYIWGFSKSKD